MEQNKQLSLQYASISGKKVTADFTGGDVTSDFGVLVMREVADKIGIAVILILQHPNCTHGVTSTTFTIFWGFQRTRYLSN